MCIIYYNQHSLFDISCLLNEIHNVLITKQQTSVLATVIWRFSRLRFLHLCLCTYISVYLHLLILYIHEYCVYMYCLILIAISYTYVCNSKLKGTYEPSVILSGQLVIKLRLNMLTDIPDNYELAATYIRLCLLIVS